MQFSKCVHILWFVNNQILRQQILLTATSVLLFAGSFSSRRNPAEGILREDWQLVLGSVGLCCWAYY